MSETYCGKACENCTWKAELNCPGCMEGPGRPIYGDCEIAKCCRDKSHKSCATCSTQCAKYRGRAEEPKFRKERLEQEKSDNEFLVTVAPMLAKWLMIIFCLSIVAAASSLVTSEAIKERAPQLYMGGSIINIVMKIAISFILLKLSSVSGPFVKAGVYMLISCVLTFIGLFIPDDTVAFALLSLLISIPNLIIELLSLYNMYTGYSDILVNADNTLAASWEELWVWTKRVMIAMIVATVLLFLGPLLGVILLIVSMIGLFIIYVIRLVYQYKSAQVFIRIRDQKYKS